VDDIPEDVSPPIKPVIDQFKRQFSRRFAGLEKARNQLLDEVNRVVREVEES
jgi:hypothetical protein